MNYHHLETIQNEDLKLILDVALPYPMSLEILVDYIINEIFADNNVENKDLYSYVLLTSSWPHQNIEKNWLLLYLAQ